MIAFVSGTDDGGIDWCCASPSSRRCWAASGSRWAMSSCGWPRSGFVSSLTCTTGSVLMARGRTDYLFYLGIVGVVLQVPAFIIGLRWGVEGVAAGHLVATVVTAVIAFNVVLRVLGQGTSAVLCAPSRQPIALARRRWRSWSWAARSALHPIDVPAVVELVVLVLVGGATYGALAFVFARGSLREVSRFFRRALMGLRWPAESNEAEYGNSRLIGQFVLSAECVDTRDGCRTTSARGAWPITRAAGDTVDGRWRTGGRLDAGVSDQRGRQTSRARRSARCSRAGTRITRSVRDVRLFVRRPVCGNPARRATSALLSGSVRIVVRGVLRTPAHRGVHFESDPLRRALPRSCGARAAPSGFRTRRACIPSH